MKDFNSHAHVERDDGTIQIVTAIADFNSHAHVERDVLLAARSFQVLDFNSHAHVERDHLKRSWSVATVISIHTLTWSVTMLLQ